MFEKLNTNFWFWILLAFFNIFTISLVMKTGDRFTLTIASCILFFSLAKALKIASDIEEK